MAAGGGVTEIGEGVAVGVRAGGGGAGLRVAVGDGLAAGAGGRKVGVTGVAWVGAGVVTAETAAPATGVTAGALVAVAVGTGGLVPPQPGATAATARQRAKKPSRAPPNLYAKLADPHIPITLTGFY